MKIRKDLTDAKKLAEKLTTRQMEFIEKMREIDLEKDKVKAGKLTSEHRTWFYVVICTAIFGIIGFGFLNLSSLYEKWETVEALKLGYEKQPRAGTTYMYWSKNNEENSNERSKVWRTENRERNSIYNRPVGRDSLGKQSEESTTILPRLSRVPNREGTNR